jgi:D-glycero-D-manno-heptose 1,7-bisphosphate phosphatase
LEYLNYAINISNEGFLILVITNQAGIAKELYSVDNFIKLTNWMVAQFQIQSIYIKKVYYCPHHADLEVPCECRKPKTDMIFKAVYEFNLDLAQCVLIGDKESDLQAGRIAGIKEHNLHLV